ncbi:MAG: DUF3667 domain-containing protein [Muribaculaceae bacterium]|nr:DUF3667 domain-containing protein [Muribaculaceae bacterium]
MKLSKKSKKKQITGASKQEQKRKPVKKNTWYRNFRAWVLRIERRQMNDTPPLNVRESVPIVCKHCGTEYTGVYCPKCSMPARWKRFDWKLLFLNFMDIWGLGNRPMFRTIRDLFWRPGYMIKDYLRGHHLSYFPPFKMLAVWTVILMFMMWLFGNNAVEPEDAKSFSDGVLASKLNSISATTSMLIDQIDRIMEYLDEHMLYGIIVQNILVVLAVKWAFRKISDFNLVETFFSQIYINCQFHILAVASMLLLWRVPEHYSLFPYMVGLIPAPIVLTYDFHQLYGITWKRALWKTIVTFFNLILLYAIVIAILIIILVIVEIATNPSSPLINGVR